MSNENKYNNLMKNTFIFMIGNFGSKVISFIIVPFYTYVLTTQEYGKVDLMTTSINLIMPFIIIGLQEAVLRFLVANEIKKEAVASNCMLIFLGTTIIIWAFYPIFSQISLFKNTELEFTILLNIMAFNQMFVQYLRGINKNVAYAMNGIILTVVLVSSNIMLLLVFKMGIRGYLFSLILSQIASSLHIILSSKLWQDIRIKYLDFSQLKIMMIYSLPLIPNSLMWWIMNASDKYMINYFVGISENGIYSIAHKLPTLINLFYSIFMQAWQITAIQENNSKDRVGFYKNVYVNICAFLILTGAIVILFSKPLYMIIMSTDFKESWKYVPILIMANIFSCLSGFFGTTYVASKRTSRAFSTTFYGAVINIGFNFLMIPFIGVMGASISTCISYMITCLIRSRDTGEYLGTVFINKNIVLGVFLLLVQQYSLFIFSFNSAWLYIYQLICIGLEIIVFKKELYGICRFIKNAIVKKYLKSLNNRK